MREGRQLLSNLETSRKEADADTRWDMTQDWDTMQRYRVWSSNSLYHQYTHVHFQNDVNFLKFPNLAVCVPAGYWLSSQIWRWLLMASLISTTSNCSSIYNCWDMSTVFKRWTNFIYLTDIQPWLTNKCFLQSQCWHLIMKWLWSYLHLLGNFDLSSQEFTFYSKWLFVNVFDEHYMFLVLTLYNWEMA